MYNISDYNYFTIEINDGGWRTWYIPKFRIYMTVDEPNIFVYWSDNERPGNGIRRMLEMDYNNVLFGAYAPSSAAEVKSLIEGLQDKAWDDIIGMFGSYVPYTGASNNVDLGAFGLTTDYVAFSQSPIVGPGNAQIGYNGATLALAYDFDSTNVRVNIGQQMYAYVINAEAVTINKGEPVYLFGASGNKATVKLAANTADATSATTLGLAAENILATKPGLVITQGVLDGIDTSAYSPGDILYVGATAGSLTATKPYAPNHLVYIGVVEKANAGNGQIFVRPQNGYELDEIHDVDLITTPPSTGDVLTYNGTLWVNQAPASGSGTVTSIATSSPITGGTITTSGTIGISNAAADGTTKGAAAFTASDFNDNGSGVISIDYTNGQAASGSNKGFLTSADWTTFNSKEPALTKGNLTEATSSVLTITGGTTAVIGSGTSIQVKQASGAQSGYLSSTDWTTFNNKGSGTVTSIATSSPITGGTITGSGTIGISDAAADGSTKGAATFTAADFNDNGSGLISIDYTNGQAASGSNKGFLTSADWTTFNGKQDLLVSGTNIKTLNGVSILGSGDLDAGYTLSVQALTSSPVDAQTIYFGNLPKAPVTTANISKVYIPRAGTIKRAEIYCYSGTAGTNQAWSGYIRLNNTTDTLIATLSVATSERVFSNSSLNIAVVAGDYFEIKFINPTWATNPLTTIFGGYIYID